MNLRLLGYHRLYKAIRALIIYRYLYEIYKNYQETLYQAESSFFDLAAWENQNTQKIEQGGDTTKQKTATGVENFSPENPPGLEQPESPICIGFKAVFIYELRPINLYYFRARYYDPIIGRFLSVDPMGYKDSMNLYQAFGMNPVNFMDPWGLAIINLFIGFEMNKANAYKVGTSHGPIPMPYPNLENLKVLAAQHGHTLNIFTKNQFNFIKVKRSINDGMGRKIDIDVSMPFNFSKKGFEESIKDEETWTFYVGHTFHNPKGNYIGLDFGNKNYISKPRLSKNRYIGIFGCSSSDFSSKIFPFAKYLFSIKEKSGEGTIGIHRALYAAYFLIEYLIKTDNFNPKEALEAANKGLLKIEEREKDRVILQP